MNKKSRTSELV